MILTGDCLEIMPTLEAESVQCCVTSPPYYGLRDYGTASWDGGNPECDHIDEVAAAEQRRNRKGLANNADENDGASRSREVQNGIDKAFQYKTSCPKCGAIRIDSQIGLEPTPEAYVEKLVAVFREVRRVLRDDGTLWLNLGDSYCSQGGLHDGREDNQPGVGASRIWRNGSGRADGIVDERGQRNRNGNCVSGLKPKDLIGIPWRVAFALQADGWWLRQDIIWAKPNPMPESVTDRCTKSHEYIFLLTKSARYFYDNIAIQEPFSGIPYKGRDNGAIMNGDRADKGRTIGMTTEARNRRSVWTITTKPFKEAHFATFPPEIPEICIKAGTSEKGCCPECGSPWERVVEQIDTGRKQKMADGWDTGEGGHGTIHRDGREKGETGKPVMANQTTGWRPTCTHNHEPIPCTVLDPFSGAGTTGQVAERLDRKYIGIELSPEYVKMSENRIEAARLPLFMEEK